MQNVIWTNQKIESSVYRWNCAHAFIDTTCFPGVWDVISSVLSIRWFNQKGPAKAVLESQWATGRVYKGVCLVPGSLARRPMGWQCVQPRAHLQPPPRPTAPATPGAGPHPPSLSLTHIYHHQPGTMCMSEALVIIFLSCLSDHRCRYFIVPTLWPPLLSFFCPDSLTACVVILLSWLSDLFNVFLSRLGVAPIHMHLCCKTTSVRHLHSHPHQQTWPCMTVSVLSCFLPSLPSHLILLSTRPPVLLSAKHSFSSPLQTCQPSCCIPLGLWLSLSFARRVVNFYKPICCTFAYW